MVIPLFIQTATRRNRPGKGKLEENELLQYTECCCRTAIAPHILSSIVAIYRVLLPNSYCPSYAVVPCCNIPSFVAEQLLPLISCRPLLQYTECCCRTATARYILSSIVAIYRVLLQNSYCPSYPVVHCCNIPSVVAEQLLPVISCRPLLQYTECRCRTATARPILSTIVAIYRVFLPTSYCPSYPVVH